MFCPECGAEYKEGVSECADCEVPLTQEPPPELEHPEPDLVAVAKISEPNLLGIVVGLLQSAGIEPVVEGDEIMGVLPVGQFGAGGWSGRGRGLSAVIKVPHDRAEEAKRLLEEADESGAEEGEALEPD